MPEEYVEVVIDLEEDIIATLQEMANERNISIDLLVEMLLKEYIGKNGELGE